ncbi:hypothetical protein BJV74DRAFT_888115 [Russula compacta]|nr:hypothetical protein BJV74DRAFT_888115 [Russula compacta]
MSSLTPCSTPVERPSDSLFAALPEEIIVKTLEYCDFKGVLACQLTCRIFRDVVTSSTSLRYKLTLSKHGMCDDPSNKLSTAEKLDLLTAHATAWQNLDSACPEKVDILVGWSVPMAVSHNIIVFSKEIWQGVPDEDDAAIGSPEHRLGLLVLRVPSALRRIDAAHWMLNLPSDVVSRLCIDASQDLLIYSDGTFHTCTLSTGAVHPLVEHEGFFSPWDEDRYFDEFDLCVCGDFVLPSRVSAIYPSGIGRQDILSLSNSIKHFKKISDDFSTFDFLDEHHIVFAISMEDSICVYDLRPRVLDEIDRKQQQQGEEETATELEAVRFQLALPSIIRAMRSRYIQVRRNALPTRQAQPTGGGASGGPPPFHADPRSRLTMLRIATSPIKYGDEQYALHLPARALLDHFAAAGERRRADGGDPVVPWSAWCDSVRVTPPRRLPFMFESRMIVYGMRAVSHPPDWDEGVLHVDSYLPRPRPSRREAGAAAGAEVRAEGGWSGTRQALRLPREVEDNENNYSVLCEDALLFYEVLDPWSTKISLAYWYTF